MVKPALKLVDTDLSGRCGAECNDGTPCLRRTDGGRCYLHRPSSPSGKSPPPPGHLGDLGREEWFRRVEGFEEAGVLDQVDLGLLEAACEAYEEARRCREVIEEFGRLIKGRTGMKKNPAHAKMLKFRKEYRMTIGDILKNIDKSAGQVSPDDPFSGADF